MKGLYEQEWKNAVAGARVEPSDALWNNIASQLDKERGRNYWVTLLMIAATVTIAFSFPLTIGDSAFESRPDSYLQIGEANVEVGPSGTTETANSNVPASNNYAIDKSNIATNASTGTNQKTIRTNDLATENSNLQSTDNNANRLPLANVQGIGISPTSFDPDNTIRLMKAEDHYFIPYYMPLNKTDDKSLLASLNMGTGSTSLSNGFSAFGNDQKAEVLASGDLTSGTRDSGGGVENNGTTLYFGAGVELPMGNRWSLLTGLGYLSQKAQGYNDIVLDNGSGYQPLGAYDPISSGVVFLSESYTYNVSNNYLSVPLSIKYPFVNRKLKFRGGIGITTDFMLSHTVNSEAYGKAVYKPGSMDYNSVVLAGQVNLDISYSLNNQYALALETGFRRGITPIDKSKQFYPSSFTVGIVLFYKFR